MTDWGSYKPVLTALALPPVPFLVLIVMGARLILPRRGLGYSLLMLGVLGLWAASCNVSALWLQNHVLKPPLPLIGEARERLAQTGRTYSSRQAQAQRRGNPTIENLVPPAAIIVLGSGLEPLAPEYGTAELTEHSASRLRYGVWLSRQTGLPLGFSGGVGWGQQGRGQGAPEADIAARVSAQQFGLPLHWVENASSDTRANANNTVAMLAEQGVSEIVLVTDAFHMPRAKRVFVEAAQRAIGVHPEWPLIKVTPAPTGYWRAGERPLLDWLPSMDGANNVSRALRECLGLLVSA